MKRRLFVVRQGLVRCTLVVAALFAAPGCVSYSHMHTATPVPAGEREVKIAAGVGGGFNAAQGADPADHRAIALLGARHGLGPRTDLGLRLNGIGVAADLNWAVILDNHFALSLDPQLSAAFQTPERAGTSGKLMTPGVAHHVAGRLMVLADVVKLDDVTITLGAGPGYMYVTGPNFLGTTGPQLKGSFGLRWEVPTGRSRGLEPIVTPAIDIVVPVDPQALERPTVGYDALFGVSTRL